MSSNTSLRIKKLAFSFSHPTCWPALALGVAPVIDHAAVLGRVECDLVIDVGANRGQFSLMARLALPGKPIVAFEPIPSEAEVFRKIHGKDSKVVLEDVALGAEPGESEIHLSRRRDSSSLLPIGRKQTEMFPDTDEVGVLKIVVKRLDDFAERWSGYSRIFLKLDVQGFELAVLKGASSTLKRCAYVYAECSEVPLYEGQALRPEVAAFLEAHGFKEESRQNETMANGALVQADYLYARE